MTWQRVLTALVLIPVVVGLVLFTPTWVVAMATAVITVLALWEYFALGDAIGHRAYRLWTIFSSLLLLYDQWKAIPFKQRGAEVSVVLFGNDHFFRNEAPYAYLVFFVFVLGLTVLTLFTRRPLVESLPSAGISASAFLLVSFPLSFAVRLHGMGDAFEGPRLLLFALVIIWASDTVAYFVGRAMGKHPLAPKISPKKTWEGSIAGMIGSLAVAYGFHYWLTVPLPHLLAMAALGNIAGQMGDLLESACKRSAGVKDSGGLLPGHGGVLDRIDALILCIPVIWYYLVLVNPQV
ncbi:MAG TPA: phosphatidate cytidylyltransferase [Candidatus Saccharimonadales bacterium]|nr:phosphatidate cytidylyltransferase [Candidatus Saccharimonadales bacterium]